MEALRRDTEPTEASTLVVVEDSVGDVILGPCGTLCTIQSILQVFTGIQDVVKEMSWTAARAIRVTDRAPTRIEGLGLTLSLPSTRLNCSH